MVINMARFHIGRKGKPSACRATKGSCPFASSDEHFSTLKEANEKIEQNYASNTSFLSSAKKVEPQKQEKEKPQKQYKEYNKNSNFEYAIKENKERLDNDVNYQVINKALFENGVSPKNYDKKFYLSGKNENEIHMRAENFAKNATRDDYNTYEEVKVEVNGNFSVEGIPGQQSGEQDKIRIKLDVNTKYGEKPSYTDHVDIEVDKSNPDVFHETVNKLKSDYLNHNGGKTHKDIIQQDATEQEHRSDMALGREYTGLVDQGM